MNYTRYLDLHLCTKKDIAAVKTEKLATAQKTGNYNKVVACHEKFFSHGGTEYFYDFRADMEQQAKYRSNVKSEGFSYDPEAFFSRNIGNCRNFSDVEITQADISMLRVVKGEISNQLRQMHGGDRAFAGTHFLSQPRRFDALDMRPDDDQQNAGQLPRVGHDNGWFSYGQQ